ELLVVTEFGYGKRTSIDDYPSQSRGGGGVITSKVTEKTGRVATARIITEKDNDLMIISASGVVIRTDVSHIKKAGRATQGVTLMNLGDGDTVVAVATTNGKKPEEAHDNGEDGSSLLDETTAIENDNEDAASGMINDSVTLNQTE